MVISLLPGGTLHFFDLRGFQSFDKAAHFGLYFIYVILLFNSFRVKRPKRLIYKGLYFKTLIIAIGLGLILEFSQKMIPERNFDFFDLIANIAGSISGLGIYTLIIISKSDVDQ